MRSIFWRIVLALIVVLFVFTVMPPLLHIFGISLSGDVQTVVRTLVGFGAVLYIIFGPSPTMPAW